MTSPLYQLFQPVDAFHFIYDSVGNLPQQRVVHVIPVRRHEVRSCHTPSANSTNFH